MGGGWVRAGVPERPLLRKHWRLCWLSPKTVRRTMRPSIAGSHLVVLQLTDPFLSTATGEDVPKVQGASDTRIHFHSLSHRAFQFCARFEVHIRRRDATFSAIFSPNIGCERSVS